MIVSSKKYKKQTPTLPFHDVPEVRQKTSARIKRGQSKVGPDPRLCSLKLTQLFGAKIKKIIKLLHIKLMCIGNEKRSHNKLETFESRQKTQTSQNVEAVGTLGFHDCLTHCSLLTGYTLQSHLHIARKKW